MTIVSCHGNSYVVTNLALWYDLPGCRNSQKGRYVRKRPCLTRSVYFKSFAQHSQQLFNKRTFDRSCVPHYILLYYAVWITSNVTFECELSFCCWTFWIPSVLTQHCGDFYNFRSLPFWAVYCTLWFCLFSTFQTEKNIKSKRKIYSWADVGGNLLGFWDTSCCHAMGAVLSSLLYRRRVFCALV